MAALVSIDDIADRPARALADGETLALGKHVVRWFDAPHRPTAGNAAVELINQAF